MLDKSDFITQHTARFDSGAVVFSCLTIHDHFVILTEDNDLFVLKNVDFQREFIDSKKWQNKKTYQ